MELVRPEEPKRCACGKPVVRFEHEGYGIYAESDQCPACEKAAAARELERLELGRRSEMLAAANLPECAGGWDFDGAEKAAKDLLAGEELKAWGQAAIFCRTWVPGGRKGLYLVGPTGTGKTVLAYCLLRSAIMGTGLSGLYLPVGELFADTVLGWRRNDAGRDLVGRAGGVRVLVLDDLGSGRLKPWQQEIVFKLLDKRISSRLPTVITTNCQLGEMDKVLGDPHGRVMSRIMGNFKGVRFWGADFRCIGAEQKWWAV